MIVINSKNFLVWGIIAGVVLLGGYFLLTNSSSPKENITNGTIITEISPTEAVIGKEEGTETTIDYTDSGFTPKSITVKAGTTVTWVNKSGKNMWVASTPHPAHTDLSGFDELQAAGSGETYSYTFTKVGNWKYHNHVLASMGGVVAVE